MTALCCTRECMRARRYAAQAPWLNGDAWTSRHSSTVTPSSHGTGRSLSLNALDWALNRTRTSSANIAWRKRRVVARVYAGCADFGTSCRGHAGQPDMVEPNHKDALLFARQGNARRGVPTTPTNRSGLSLLS